MFGDNPIRPPVAGDGQALEVKHIFATLQGEGPYAGLPAVFIRLGGCNLACDFCDTEFEGFSSMTLEEILKSVRGLRHCEEPKATRQSRLDCFADARNDGTIKLIVITGGEPLRQNIAPLCDTLLEQGYTVQIETNGTLWRPLDARVKVVCSPKITNGTYHPLREDVLARADAIKFIVSATHPKYGAIADVGQGKYGIPVYIQPMDEQDEAKNRANQELAAQLAMATGARLSLQLHKILGIE